MRNHKGQFEKGRQESIEEKEVRIKSLVNSWKNREDYIGDIKNPKVYNCWRSFMFTLKGKKIGCSEEWKDYRNYYNDVIETYEETLIFSRIDKKAPFSKENFIWLDKEIAANIKDNTIKLEYNSETKTLKEWSIQFRLSVNGIKLRYHRDKNLTSEEILFGKKKVTRRALVSATDLETQKLRDKASKMCSSYKIKDRKRRFDFDLNIEWLIENILLKNCTYCGTDRYIGCDRLDNNRGHTKDNVVPCCITCNTVRGNNFTFDEMKILGKTIAQIKHDR